MSQKLICPNCNNAIDLDKIANERYTKMLLEQEKKLIEEQERQKNKFEKELEEKTSEMRKKAQEFAEKKVEEERKKIELEMKDMEERLKKSDEERQESKKNELNLIKKQRDLEDKEKNFDLEMEKKLIEERKKIEEKLQETISERTKKEIDEKMEKIQEDFRKKELEYQKQHEQLKKSLDDAKRKAEQGSQQIQGDIQEDDLKQALIGAFPIDDIQDIPTGIKGADIIQVVKTNLGQVSGIIVWESKNTKSWSDSWIMKLKDDKLKVNGNIAILVSSVLPKSIKYFGMIDDIMLCSPEFAILICKLLRDKLLSISKVEKSLEGKELKMELLYKYLSSEEFNSKLSMILDVFSNLKYGIDAERRAMEKNWKKREKDIERASFAVTGIYGELESLMGQSLVGSDRLNIDSDTFLLEYKD